MFINVLCKHAGKKAHGIILCLLLSTQLWKESKLFCYPDLYIVPSSLMLVGVLEQISRNLFQDLMYLSLRYALCLTTQNP